MAEIVLPAATVDLGTWAHFYAHVLKWPVFPCHGKVPAIPAVHRRGDPLRATCHGECGRLGHGFYDATLDLKLIEHLWWQYVGANIGTPMSNTRFALDIDPRNRGQESLAALEKKYGPLPRTTLSLTGGGGEHHIFEKHGLIFAPGKINLGPGIDVQNEGHYILLPASHHPVTGLPYIWEADFSPSECPPQPPPPWLEELLVQGSSFLPQAETRSARSRQGRRQTLAAWSAHSHAGPSAHGALRPVRQTGDCRYHRS